MKRMFLRLFLMIFMTAITLLYLGVFASAAPYDGEVFKLKQPDNTYVDVKIWGDEFYQRVESLDGYTLCYDPQTNWICYAKIDENTNDFVSTGIIYKGGTKSDTTSVENKRIKKGLKLGMHSIRKKAKDKYKELFQIDNEEDSSDQLFEPAPVVDTEYAAATGVRGLTILIDFSDNIASKSKNEIDNSINQPGYNLYGNNGSVRDYFYDVSGGQLEYTNDVVGYYRALKPKSYYNDPAATGRARELVREALDNMEKNGYDFSKLTVNSRKMVMAVNVLYSGNTDVAWNKGLWPHSGSINTFYADGVNVSRYQISNIGTSTLRIGTFVHENGHMVCGYPDLYDYDSNSKGVGRFCVMASNHATNPQPPSPYMRNVISGWGTITDLNGYPNNSKVTVKTNSLDTYRFKNPNKPNEFFLIESLRRQGRWSTIPDEGLVVWHVDTNGSNNYNEMTVTRHYKVSLEQADGLFNLENNVNTGDANDLFHFGYKTSFNSTTVPNSNWWDGSASGLGISDVSSVGDTMTFTIQTGNTASSMPTIKPTSTPTPRPTSTPTQRPTSTSTPTSTQTPTSTPTIPRYEISGYIKPDINITNENSLSGFKIEILESGISAVTDEKGYFRVGGVLASQNGYTIKVSNQGYLSRIFTSIVVIKNVTLGSQSVPLEIWGGDLNQDDSVNMADVLYMANCFSTSLGDGRYNARCDLNGDNNINMADTIILAKHFNSTQSNYIDSIQI